jgi:hypothetical protein
MAPGGAWSDRLAVTRREILAGGADAGALLALPDLSWAARQSRAAAPPSVSASRYVLLYGTPETSGPAPMPPPKAIAAQLAAAPVASPDQSSVALVTIDEVTGGAKVTLTLVSSDTAVVGQQGSLTITGIAAGSSIIATPVFAPGTTTIALVLGVTEPTDPQPAVRRGSGHRAAVPFQAVTWVTHHELAYFDTASGCFSGPFSLGNAPALALHTAAANSADLFLWTTAEPRPGSPKGTAAPLPWISAFPLGSGTARFCVPAPGPRPGGEPVATLPGGDIARLVNSTSVQVASAGTGEVTQTAISALGRLLAKPSAVTMTMRPDGSVFLAKPGAGRALITDPMASFGVLSQVEFPPPPYPGGGPSSKAVLSASGKTLYVLGGAGSGGLSAYDVASGTLTGSYSRGTHYNGLYLLPCGDLLAVGPANPRAEFFSPDLDLLGTATTTLQIAAAF